MDLIWRRKKNWIHHILIDESLLNEVIRGRMIGKRLRERRRLGMLNEILKEAEYAELKKKAENRKEWKIWKPKTCLTIEHKRLEVESNQRPSAPKALKTTTQPLLCLLPSVLLMTFQM